MDTQKKVHLSQKLYGIVESFKEECSLSDEEIKEILMEVYGGF